MLVTGCTAHFPINDPIPVVTPDQGYRQSMISKGNRSDTLFVALAFSGGGTRAAALSYGVLEGLRDVTINWEGKERRLLDEIDIISSVSGGSFTAAYYGLFADRIFEDYKEKFLYRDVQSHLTGSLWKPWNWFLYGSAHYGRSEYAANYYDQILFEGKTFGDILDRNGPFIRVNASDISLGAQFTFVQEIFDLLCSDVSTFPVSRAVAASSAVPVLFTSITVKNYSNSCNYELSPWAQEALDSDDKTSRRYYVANKYFKYLEGDIRPYIHLYDGGLTDNLGVRPYINRVALFGGAWELLKQTDNADIKRTIIIVVNAKAELKSEFNQSGRSLSLSDSIASSSATPLNEYSFETMNSLRRLLQNFDQEIAEGRCKDLEDSGQPTEGCDDIEHYLIEIDLDRLDDRQKREHLLQLPTSFRLEPEEVDGLVDAARETLNNSKEFKALMQDLQ